MRPQRPSGPRPLESRPTIPTTPTTFAEILPELREHFPYFEEELRREHGVGLEIFKHDATAAGALYVLVLAARHEFRRRLRFAASHLRQSLDDAERFAIQTEGEDPRGQHQTIRRPEHPQENPLADPGRIPARTPGP